MIQHYLIINMKIENRSKNLIRFKTTIGNITLNPGINELTKEEFDAVKIHPMFDSIVKTSGLVVIEEKSTKSYKTKAELKAEKEADKEVKESELEENSLESKEDSKEEIETKNLNKVKLINSKK